MWQDIETAPKIEFDKERWFASGIRVILANRGSKHPFYGAWEYTEKGKGRWVDDFGRVRNPDIWHPSPEPPK